MSGGEYNFQDFVVPAWQIHSAVCEAVMILWHEFRHFALRLNFSKGKTEAILHLHGPGAKDVARSIHAMGSKFVVNMPDGSSVTLAIVDKYKSLGGYVTLNDGSPLDSTPPRKHTHTHTTQVRTT